MLSSLLNFDEVTAGIYIGATIHDVAQVVGAGFSISDTAGETATLVKLLRVAMLAPVVIVASLAIRSFVKDAGETGARPQVLPSFLVVFVICAAAVSFGLVPQAVSEFAAQLSRWMLLMAIAAVGLKTRPKDILGVGVAAVWLIVAETVFLAAIVWLGLHWLVLS